MNLVATLRRKMCLIAKIMNIVANGNADRKNDLHCYEKNNALPSAASPNSNYGNCDRTITPNEMMQRLKSLTNVDEIVCGRPKSGKSPDAKHVEFTIMQLIARDLVTLKSVEDENNKLVTIVLLKLNEDSMAPACLC